MPDAQTYAWSVAQRVPIRDHRTQARWALDGDMDALSEILCLKITTHDYGDQGKRAEDLTVTSWHVQLQRTLSDDRAHDLMVVQGS